ncbi:MAG: hypothetical protein HY270_23295, partial [Deltaproteobacteria bacterium]|nr:hypothetical protein [Deltaproteobacteria bacterium]
MTQRPMLRVLPFVVVGQSADLDLRAAVESAASYVQRMLPDGDEKSLNLAELTLVSTNTTVAGALAQGFAMHRLRVAAGGGAFLAAYPEVRQFLSAMRAIADRDDGAAQAALFAPPLFAIEPADFLASLAVKDDSHPPRARLKRAREVAEKIRQRRHMQSPGATARDLIEHSALGRVCAARVAGDLLLEALYETAGFLDKWASREGLDFDALADLCQVWADGGLPQSFAVPQGAAAASLMLVSDAAELRFRVACVVEASDSCLAAASNLATELVVLAVPVEVADVWTPPVQRFA